MCLKCRNSFTQEEIDNKNACPNCGDTKVPADPRKMYTTTLTEHEWRILCIWASNYGNSIKSEAIEYIINEIRRQNPDIGPLSMSEEFSAVKKALPDVTVEYVEENNSTKINLQ